MMTSSKPYLIRALYDWIVDNDLTPYIVVDATAQNVQVPQQFVNDGRIILNISPKACRGLHLENSHIVFTARFSGVAEQIALSPTAVLAIYAKENGRGMVFDEEEETTPPPGASEPVPITATSSKPKSTKPTLTVVK